MVQVGHSRRLHIDTSPTGSESETFHREPWYAGSGGQVAWQGHSQTNTTFCQGNATLSYYTIN